jgi:hypothetical protein
LRRALRRLAAGRFSDTVIAVGTGVDHDHFAARAELARAAARKTAGGPLTLIASEHCATELRHQLLALAQALISEFGCPSVRVRFAAPS